MNEPAPKQIHDETPLYRPEPGDVLIDPEGRHWILYEIKPRIFAVCLSPAEIPVRFTVYGEQLIVAGSVAALVNMGGWAHLGTVMSTGTNVVLIKYNDISD